jgi:hypothetical protein
VAAHVFIYVLQRHLETKKVETFLQMARMCFCQVSSKGRLFAVEGLSFDGVVANFLLFQAKSVITFSFFHRLKTQTRLSQSRQPK